MPEGTKKAGLLGSTTFGAAYGGERSGYEKVSALTGNAVVLTVPAA
jgi:hypothetical protein